LGNEGFQKEMVELRVEINHVKFLLQGSQDDQIYGWITRKKKVRWNSLQRKLRQNVHAKLEEEMREIECEMDVFICKFEQRLFFDEEVEFLEE